MIASEGLGIILGAAACAAVLFSLALRQRSWSLWLAAYVVLLLTLGISWYHRTP